MSRFQIEEGKFHGADAVILKDTESGWEGTVIPEIGSNLISFRSTGEGIDVLTTPGSLEELKANTTGWGFPVLMPPNRIEQGKFTFNGREYIFEINEKGKYHIHGIVHDLPWRVVATSTDGAASVTTAIRSDEHPKIKGSYPHSFELRMTFSLQGKRMDITVEAENFGSDPMPFGVGFHPYFNVPLSPSSSKELCTVQVPAKQLWELDDLIPTGRRLPVAGDRDLRQPKTLSGVMLDDVFTDLDFTQGASVAELKDNGAAITVRYGAGKEFKHWVVWTGKTPQAPFVCLEPYTWVTNAPNLPLPPEDTGLIVLQGGETFTGRMWVEIIC
ncbi:MAG: aldose 1-epimerase [Firmicutes bacterium]|nr:aldose 1-epimerase [Bacillota bacterium]